MTDKEVESVSHYVENYRFEFEDGRQYTPNEQDKALLEDAIESWNNRTPQPASVAQGAVSCGVTDQDKIETLQKLVAEYQASTIAAAKADVAAHGLPGARGQGVPAGLDEAIAEKLQHPVFKGLSWETYDAYLPLKFVGYCSVSDWYATTPSGKKIIVSAADKDGCITLASALTSTMPSPAADPTGDKPSGDCPPASAAMGLSAAGEARCQVCDWTMADSWEKGCIQGNCSYRPDDPAEQERIRRRRAQLSSTEGK